MTIDGIYRFNEAAGFTRRKQGTDSAQSPQTISASMRPPDLPGGNNASEPSVPRQRSSLQ